MARVFVLAQWLAVICGSVVVLIGATRLAVAPPTDRFTSLSTIESGSQRPDLLGKQITVAGLKGSHNSGEGLTYVFLMPSCDSCNAGAVDARFVEQGVENDLVFVYPGDLTEVPIDELPVGQQSRAVSSDDVTGLSTLDYAVLPAILALNESSVVIAQSTASEDFGAFRKRVGR